MSNSLSNVRFHVDLARFAEKLGIAKRTVVQKVSLDLWTGITVRTPVLTGRARANWMLTQDAPSDAVKLYPDAKPGDVGPPAPPDVSAVTGDAPVFIVNNLPYISALEDGSSKQAPHGFVKLTMQEEAARIEAAIDANV